MLMRHVLGAALLIGLAAVSTLVEAQAPLVVADTPSSAAQSGPAVTRRGDLFGVVTHYWGDAIPTRMRELGASWARVHCSWAEVQPTPDADPSTWNWACPDQAMAAATQGFRVLYGLGYAPSWANGGRSSNYAPTGDFLSAWTHYCAELMRRYSGRGVVYEVWNEPNLDVFFMGSFEDYVNLVRAASQAVRAVDPTGLISGPETSNLNTPGRETWHDDAVSRLGTMFDVVTSHWYCGSRCGSTADAIATQVMAYVDTRTATLPVGVPFWLTETGADTSSDAVQARFYDGVLQAYLQNFAGPRRTRPAWQNVFFYHLLAPDNATIVRTDAARTPRQAFRRYQEAIRGTAIAVPRK
jgi:hypothetical protein